MNAYELAKELDKYKGIATKQASDMLRQQADRIAELEKATGFAGYCNGMMVFEDKSPQIKELSDEEIYEVLYSVDWAYDPVKFAREILKKAGEK